MRITIFVHTSDLENLKNLLGSKMMPHNSQEEWAKTHQVRWKKYRDSLESNEDKHMFVEVQLSYDDFIYLSDYHDYEL